MLKEFRLNDSTYVELRHGKGISDRDVFLKYLRKTNAAGREKSDFASFRSRGPVSLDFAKGFISFAKEEWKYTPLFLVEFLQKHSVDEAFDLMFERVPTNEIPKQFEPPNERNDPCMRGLPYLGSVIQRSVTNYLVPRINGESPLVYFDPICGPAEYARLAHTEIGYSQSSPRKNLSPDEAYAQGIEFAREVPGFFENCAARMMAINPDCLRYAVNRSGVQLGFSLAHAITDAAFDATLAGKKLVSHYDDADIVPFSNNIVLEMLGEVHSVRGRINKARVIAAVAFQVALLIDPDDPSPLRFIAPQVIDSNTRRTKKLGFREIKTFKRKGKPDITMTELSPNKRTIEDSTLIRMLHDLVLRIRKTIIETKPPM